MFNGNMQCVKESYKLKMTVRKKADKNYHPLEQKFYLINIQ